MLHFAELVLVLDMFVLLTEEIQIARDDYILLAVFDHLRQLTLLEPFNRLDAVGAFAVTERGGGNRIKRQAKPQDAVNILK